MSRAGNHSFVGMPAAAADGQWPIGAPASDASLEQRLFPNDQYLQAEHRRAVSVVRSTSRGWLLDHQIGRRP